MPLSEQVTDLPRPIEGEPSSASGRVDRLRAHKRIATAIVVAAALLLVAAWRWKGTFVDAAEALPELRQQPVQGETDLEPFAFSYAGKRYTVEPVASYELWGLVVSHNDIESFMDLVHDETSVDTKDICVIWGENLATNDFHRVAFTSGDFTCFMQYPNGVEFDFRSISNNHLITDSQVVRDEIGRIRVGDQVHLVGSLVNYQEAGMRFWRRSSTTRRDMGDRACEVVFVDEIEILVRGTPVWYALYPLAWLLLVAAAVVRIGLFVWSIVRDAPGA